MEKQYITERCLALLLGDWIYLVPISPFEQGRQLLRFPVCSPVHHALSENRSI